MRKTVLKRSLFIGLGGTGASALLQTKKRFLDTFGELPPMIGFLSIDTDMNTETKSVDRDNILEEHLDRNSEVKFEKSELIHIKVRGAAEAYKRQAVLFDWVPEENAHVLRNMVQGAGQIRSNGRFALHFNYQEIIDAVSSKINQLLSLQITENSNFIPKGTDIEINFVFSIGGGTGSGIFADIAYLVKDAVGTANNTTSIAFMVLPDVFTTMTSGPAMMNVKPNAYGALNDLDFLMQKNIDKLNLSIRYQKKTIDIRDNPFDIVFTVNNMNTEGETLSDIKEISEQIGLAMFVGSSELSANINSAYDNVLSLLSGGVLDVGNKRAWAGGMGVSELFYDGNTLANIYANRVVSSMIVNLTTESYESQNLANDFIDDPNVSIRENDGNDFLIDSLLKRTPSSRFTEVEDIEGIESQISNYLVNVEDFGQKSIQANYDNRIRHVISAFYVKLYKIINGDSGVSNALHFINDLSRQLAIFLDEMKNEEEEFQSKWKRFMSHKDESIIFLNENKGISSIFRKAEIKSMKSELTNQVNQLSETKNELLRREYAIKFLNTLSVEIKDVEKNVQLLKNRLGLVREEVERKAANFQNNVSDKRKVFVIDLHKLEVNRIVVSDSDFVIADFLQTLSSSNKLYDFYSITDTKVISDYFWNYAKKLSRTLNYVNKTIDDILAKNSEDENQEIAKQLLSKSNALWKYDLQGYVVGDSIHKDFVIGLPTLNSTFKESFSSLENNQNISFVHTGVHNKVVCYRMEVAVPVFAVNDVVGYEKPYKRSNVSHHLDRNWTRKIEIDGFSIWPEAKEDHTLESWVMGIIYGIVDVREGIYCVQSKEKGVPRKNYWMELSTYRDEAFNLFVKDNFVEEVIGLVEFKRKQQGEDNTNILMRDVVENYLEKYSKNTISSDDLDKRENERIAELIDREIDFTDKELSKYIK